MAPKLTYLLLCEPDPSLAGPPLRVGETYGKIAELATSSLKTSTNPVVDNPCGHPRAYSSGRAGIFPQIRCARAGRLWESLLDEHPTVAFLMLRVADMRATLGNKLMTPKLYKELQAQLNDATFGAWLVQFQREAYSEVRDNPNSTLHPSQRWRMQTCEAPFPYCKLLNAQMQHLRTDLEQVMSRYLNYHSIELNILEVVVQFNPLAVIPLVRGGFYDQAALAAANITGGAVRDRPEALAILRDTRETLELAIEMAKSPQVSLSVETICRMHKVLMRTSRGENHLSYTCTNVTASSRNRAGQMVTVQFCPYHEVDKELQVFCERLRELLQIPDMDPFATAAWISYIFASIHPFEDGNGRLSRILSSIPLLKNGLPPICVPAQSKLTYFEHLQQVRANSDGDYSGLMTYLYTETEESLSTLHTYFN
ncbi:fido domain-containing protein [Cerioporus squamosus]|nr:fido domain-containing protein [Cerioporus squamosus]